MLLSFGRYYSKSHFVISGWCYCLLISYCIGRCYCQWLVADVIPLRLMLLPIIYVFYTMADVITIVVADVITTLCLIYIWLMLLPCVCGRCYNHWGSCYCLLCLYFLADVIANILADVIATECNVLADGIAKWQMEWPL